MNARRNVITGVTASLLVSGLLPSRPALGQAPPARPAEQKRGAKVDPAVLAAANEIYPWLEGTVIAQAKTRDDVAKKFPAMAPPVIEQALARLMYEGRIKQAGDGSASNPYRYYDKTTGTG